MTKSPDYDYSYLPPPSALTIWADSRYIYVLLPAKPGAEIPDPILSLPRTGRGMSELLALIYGKTESHGNVLTGAPRKLIGTAHQHELAQSLLRKRGLVK